MAALTFPLTAAQLADQIPIESVSWNLERGETHNPFESGQILTTRRRRPYWSAEVQSTALTHAAAAEIQSLINSIGSSDTFYLYDPSMKYPANASDGTGVGSGDGITIKTINADLKRITLQGCPAGFQIKAGEFIAIDYDSDTRRFLVQALEDKTADGSGDMGLFEIRPHLSEAINTTDTAFLAKAAAKMKIVPGSDRRMSISPTLSRITFTAVQDHGAD